MSLSRRRRRIRNLANLGFLPFGFAMAMLETNDARIVAAALGVLYALAVSFWLLRANRCPECGLLLSTCSCQHRRPSVRMQVRARELGRQ